MEEAETARVVRTEEAEHGPVLQDGEDGLLPGAAAQEIPVGPVPEQGGVGVDDLSLEIVGVLPVPRGTPGS